MGEQYFVSSPQSKSDVREMSVVLREIHLHLLTDSGVFSRGSIDYGTRLLIDAIVLESGSLFLDLGCGYGPVGIAIAASSANVTVYMVDVNERAVALAQENAKRNHLLEAVHIQISDGLSSVNAMRFDVIALNPPIRAGKQTVYRLLEEALQHLSDSGRLYIVIQKKQGAESAYAHLQTLGANIEIVTKSKGFYVYCCTLSKFQVD